MIFLMSYIHDTKLYHNHSNVIPINLQNSNENTKQLLKLIRKKDLMDSIWKV